MRQTIQHTQHLSRMSENGTLQPDNLADYPPDCCHSRLGFNRNRGQAQILSARAYLNC
jgi:hypothetical protein